MQAKVRKLVIGVALVVAFTLLVLQPFLLPINAQTTTTLSSSSGTSVVESKDWIAKPKLANGTVTIYVPPEVTIIINNTQKNATPAPFDQFINITKKELENVLGASVASTLWNQSMSYKFLNLLFLNSSDKPLYAWIENYSSTWVAVWVKLPNGIPASSSVAIGINFTDSIQYPYTGIAPELTSTYGQYDNGKDVFIAYWNFAGTSAPSGINVYTSDGSVTFNNSVTIKGGTSTTGGENGIATAESFSPPTIVDFYGTQSTSPKGDSWGWNMVGFSNSLSSSDSFPTASGGTYTLLNFENGINARPETSQSGTATNGTLSTPSNNLFPASVWTYIYTPSAFYGYQNYINSTGYIVNADDTASLPFIIMVGNNEASYDPNGMTVYWLRVRPYPPNGVMPSVTISATPNTTILAGQYIAWSYKPEGNTLNITIDIKNDTTGIHGFPGLVIYSANMGNYTSDNSTSGFSAILISFSGAVAYHSPDASTYTFINASAFPEPEPPFNMTVTLAKDPFGDTSVFKVYINKTVYILNVSLPLPWSQIGYIGLRVDPGNNLTSTDPTVTAYNTTIGATATITATTTTTKTIANATITSTTTTTTTTTVTTTTTATTTTTTTTTLTTTSTVTATKVATTTTTSTVTSTVTTAATTVYVTTTITSTVTVKSATSSGLSLSSIYVLVAVVTILVAIPAGIMASRSTAQDSGRRYVQKA